MNASDIRRQWHTQEEQARSPYMRQWTQLIKALGKRGARFVEIIKGKKLPTSKAWNQTANTLSAEQAIACLAKGSNIGLAGGTGNLYVIDFDRDAERGHDSDHLGGGAYTYRANAPDRAKYIFFCPDPIPTRHYQPAGIDLIGFNANGTHAQATIAGMHHSGAPILWGGSNIPVLSADTVAALWEEWTDRPLFAPERSARDIDDIYANVELAIVADALEYANPNDAEMDYTSWIGIIAAVRDAFDGSGEALDLTVEWADGKPGEVEAKWQSFDREYTGQPTTLKSLFYFARRGGWVEPIEDKPTPLPEGAKVLENGTIVLKTTPTPERPKRPAPPVLTPSVVAKLAEALRGPMANTLIDRLGTVRDREGWRNFFIQLVTRIAPSQKGWVFDAGQDWLGEQVGISGVAVRKKMHTAGNAGLIRYLHTGKVDGGKSGRSVMRVDLQPMIADLWESCSKLENKVTQDNKEFSNFRNDPPTNVHAEYAGTGKFADASMRTLYKFAVARMGYPTVLARSVTKSALTFLDFLVRIGEATRAEAVEGTGMTAGAAAGGARIVEQLGLVSVEWDGPGTPKIYVLRQDWEAHLQATIPHMVSYGARVRLVIRNYDRWINSIERQLETTYAPQMRQQLSERKRQLESARKKWCVYGNKIGAYGRYSEVNPPWQ